MRLIGLLIALLIVGLLVANQLRDNGMATPSVDLPTSENGVPQVPQRPDQVPEFRKQMNQFVEKQNQQTQEKIKRLTQ